MKKMTLSSLGSAAIALSFSALSISSAAAQDAGTGAVIDPMTNEQVKSYDWIRPEADYIRREVMIPMRDGTKLYTVIVMRKGTTGGPMLMSRTPYNANRSTLRNRSQKIEEILPVMDADFVNDGYIRVYQDVRGLGKSEGEYVMNRPLRGGKLNTTPVDHATDTYDTIDWLVKNVKESNGRVGIIGSSYLGFTSLMALVDPHPALKASVPQSPMVDGWMGDDWYHNGAFRQFNVNYFLGQTVKEGGGRVPTAVDDDYTAYLETGSAGDWIHRWGIEQLPVTQKFIAHQTYDAFWQEQAVDKQLAKRGLTVPTMLVVGQWDQEDSYGAPAVYKALADKYPDLVSLVIGPWRHSGVNYEARSLGALQFKGDTGWDFRHNYLKPFLDCHLKTPAPKCDTPHALTYATGIDQWEKTATWPAGKEQPLYLAAGGKLSLGTPVAAGSESYVSDPAKPVPNMPRPVHLDGDEWRTWLVRDQRFVDGRPDVLTFSTDVLTKPLHIRGAPRVDLFASTSAQDSDYVVKLIDVYPAENTANPTMAGYELPIGIEIFRGRYVHGFATPAPLESGKTYRFGWSLPNVNHVFLPGHKLMVQVQSSLFPVYDRNPQGWAQSIMFAKPADYVKATETVSFGGDKASAVYLPVAP